MKNQFKIENVSVSFEPINEVRTPSSDINPILCNPVTIVVGNKGINITEHELYILKHLLGCIIQHKPEAW